jgi:hypothetical protein
MRIKLLNEGVVDSAGRSVEGKPSYGWGAAGLGMIPDAIEPVQRLIRGGKTYEDGMFRSYDAIAGKQFKDEQGKTRQVSPTQSDPYLKQKDLATVALTAGGAVEGVADLLGKSENSISKWIAHPALIGGIGVKDAFETANQLRQAKELWNAGKTREAGRKGLEAIEPATVSAASLATLGSHYLPNIIPATPATTGTFARSMGGSVTGLTNRLDKLATEYENEGIEGVDKALDTMDWHDATNAAWGAAGPAMDWALRNQMTGRIVGKIASKALPLGIGMIPSALYAGKHLGHGIMDASSGNWELALKRAGLAGGELTSGLAYVTGGGAVPGALADVGIALKQQQLEKEEEEMDAEEHRKQAKKDAEARLKRAAEQRKERLQPVFEQFRARERERERERDEGKGGERLSDAERAARDAPEVKPEKEPKQEKPAEEKPKEKKPGFIGKLLKGLGIATTGAVAGIAAGANTAADTNKNETTPLKYFDPTREEIAGNETLVASAKIPQFDWYRNQWYTMPTRIVGSTIINEGKLTPKESLQRKLKKQRYKVSYVQDGKKVEVFASSIRGVRRVVYGKKQYRVHNSTGSDVTGYFKKLLGE